MIYIKKENLAKALQQFSGATQDTPTESRSSRQYKASYAKKPVGVAAGHAKAEKTKDEDDKAEKAVTVEDEMESVIQEDNKKARKHGVVKGDFFGQIPGGKRKREEEDNGASRLKNDEDDEDDLDKAKKPLKDPEGGLTAAGRAHFKKKEGANLKPGVKGAADTPEKKKRKGSFLSRMFGSGAKGSMTDEKGNPTRRALSAKAWGEPVPKNDSDRAKLAAKGKKLLEQYGETKKSTNEAMDLLKSMVSELPKPVTYTNSETVFMTEVLGYNENAVCKGFVSMSRYERKQYNEWLLARLARSPSQIYRGRG